MHFVRHPGGRVARDEDGERRQPDQPRYDQSESAGRCFQQEEPAGKPAGDGDWAQVPSPGALAGQFGSRTPDRADAAEHEGDRVGHVGTDGRKPNCQEGRVADKRRQSRHAPAQAGTEPGQHQPEWIETRQRLPDPSSQPDGGGSLSRKFGVRAALLAVGPAKGHRCAPLSWVCLTRQQAAQKAPCPRNTKAGVIHRMRKSHQMDHEAT